MHGCAAFSWTKHINKKNIRQKQEASGIIQIIHHKGNSFMPHSEQDWNDPCTQYHPSLLFGCVCQRQQDNMFVDSYLGPVNWWYFTKETTSVLNKPSSCCLVHISLHHAIPSRLVQLQVSTLESQSNKNTNQRIVIPAFLAMTRVILVTRPRWPSTNREAPSMKVTPVSVHQGVSRTPKSSWEASIMCRHMHTSAGAPSAFLAWFVGFQFGRIEQQVVIFQF